MRTPHAARRLGEIAGSQRPPVLALTATPTDAVLADIVKQLELPSPRVVRTSPERENLRLDVIPVADDDEKQVELRRVLASGTGQCIVYTASVKMADELWSQLSIEANPAIGAIGRYHGQLSTRAREESQAAFMAGQYRVLIATKAFGMGVDKKDVRFVVHYQVPDSIESYAQEVGRAGRDGKPARAVLLYRRADRRTWDFLHRKNYPKEADARALMASVLALPAGAAVDEEALRTEFALGERKIEMLLWELTREQVTERAAAGFRRTAIGDQDAANRVVARLVERRVHQRESLEAMLDFAESPRCRTALVIQHFGAHLERACCGRCDACDRALARCSMNAPLLQKRESQGLAVLRDRIRAARIPRARRGESIVLATWNIRELGKSPRRPESLHYIAEVLRSFDLAVLIELREDLTELRRVLRLLGPGRARRVLAEMESAFR